MASSGKKKTTMAKLNREARLRERRLIKEASMKARKLARNEPPADDVQPQLASDGAESTDASITQSPTRAV
jgi:hypothetical protein